MANNYKERAGQVCPVPARFRAGSHEYLLSSAAFGRTDGHYDSVSEHVALDPDNRSSILGDDGGHKKLVLTLEGPEVCYRESRDTGCKYEGARRCHSSQSAPIARCRPCPAACASTATISVRNKSISKGLAMIATQPAANA
jgi:hypothetical protein